MKKWFTYARQLPHAWFDLFRDPFYSLIVVVSVIVATFVWTSAEALTMASSLRFDAHTVPQALVVLGLRTSMHLALVVCAWAVISCLLIIFAFALMSLIYGVGKMRGDKSVEALFDL
jgi:hypothetical protein